jgi:N-acetylmuramoyl-L-alanine amidase
MALQIIQAPSPNFDPRPVGALVDLVVMHATAGTNSLGWLRSPVSRVSSHYLIARDGTIYQLVQEDQMAWHAGVSFWRGRSYMNAYSIGIEMENLNNGVQPYPQAQFQAAVELVRDICARRTIPPDREHIVTHADIAPRRKNDPRNFNMEAFRAAVASTPNADSGVYYVVPQRVNIRQGPETRFPVAGTLERGQQVYVDEVITGEMVAGENRWAHLADGRGFVWLRLLRRA